MSAKAARLPSGLKALMHEQFPIGRCRLCPVVGIKVPSPVSRARPSLDTALMLSPPPSESCWAMVLSLLPLSAFQTVTELSVSLLPA
ncbi:hypothetical protein [Streptomyces colonosanans]|uniref:Uncharacterized protein n=1 Tax=Streptomyces colonosanans TaxID=1428652 RepID=A0A1S2NVS1_9ACTN|nr:hypothetical protein [Streptomyces colonosanans]OIJ85658.1 hypothetical protein BIV24_27990 [Streptomyces colonosanans]